MTNAGDKKKKTVDQSPMVNTAMLVFAVSGSWCPLWWPPRWNFVYYLYFSLTNFVLFTHLLTELINLIVDINTLSDFTNKCLSLIPTINACCKAINILVHRRKITAVLSMLRGDHCRVRNTREAELERKYEKLIRWINVTCLILDLAVVISLLIHPFVNNFEEKELPYKAWFPFAINTETTFWTIFVYESVASLIAAGFFAANDLLVISIILEICRQLDMLSYRLSDLTVNDDAETGKPRIRRGDDYATCYSQDEKTKEKLVDCVAYHIFIFQLAEATQGCFVATFATTMITSLFGTCTGAYHLSRFTVGSPDFNKAGLMFSAMVYEVFLYCWFGNELRLKSLQVGDAVYKMDWFNLKTHMRKDLLNISMRANQPIIFRSVPTASLSLDVFVSILQTSYTVFTVLKRIGIKSSNAMLSGAQTF